MSLHYEATRRKAGDSEFQQVTLSWRGWAAALGFLCIPSANCIFSAFDKGFTFAWAEVCAVGLRGDWAECSGCW
jgi:hypothetical protein